MDQKKKKKKKQQNPDKLKRKPLEKKKPHSSKKKNVSKNRNNTLNQTKKKKKRKKSKKATKTRKIVTFVFDIFFFVLIFFMLVGAAIFTMSDKEDKSFYGYRFYEVLTNSMKKTEKGQTGNFVAGDMIIVKVGDVDKIDKGDIITFVPNKESKETYLTHRVIKKTPANPGVKQLENGQTKTTNNFPIFQTQGDANNAPDPPVNGDMVIGVVKVALPKVGTIIKFVRSNLIATLIFVSAFFLMITLIRGYFAPDPEPVKKKKRKRKK